MIPRYDPMSSLKKNIEKEKKIVIELNSLFKRYENSRTREEINMFSSQIGALRRVLQKTNEDTLKLIERVSLSRPLHSPATNLTRKPNPDSFFNIGPKATSTPAESPDVYSPQNEEVYEPPKTPELPEIHISVNPTKLERKTLKRLRRKEVNVREIKKMTANKFISLSSRLFSRKAKTLLKKPFFQMLERDLIKGKLQFTPISYISVILLTTIFSIFIGIGIFVFFLFFNIGPDFPIITKATEIIGQRFFKIFWIPFVVPIITFFLMYFYPALEKKSLNLKLNRELPFATIHMAAISESMIEPSKIFSIIISTGEYPNLEKEFIKIINEINIYGHDFATSLRNVAFNSPSSKLSDLLNGLATTINSGGNLPTFFEKRSQSLLFEHRIEREQETKSAETFMDIYISVVVAAPMILMLLLMMMSISGLSWMSPSMVGIIMVLGVSVANMVFLIFLHTKKSSE